MDPLYLDIKKSEKSINQSQNLQSNTRRLINSNIKSINGHGIQILLKSVTNNMANSPRSKDFMTEKNTNSSQQSSCNTSTSDYILGKLVQIQKSPEVTDEKTTKDNEKSNINYNESDNFQLSYEDTSSNTESNIRNDEFPSKDQSYELFKSLLSVGKNNDEDSSVNDISFNSSQEISEEFVNTINESTLSNDSNKPSSPPLKLSRDTSVESMIPYNAQQSYSDVDKKSSESRSSFTLVDSTEKENIGQQKSSLIEQYDWNSNESNESNSNDINKLKETTNVYYSELKNKLYPCYKKDNFKSKLCDDENNTSEFKTQESNFDMMDTNSTINSDCNSNTEYTNDFLIKENVNLQGKNHIFFHLSFTVKSRFYLIVCLELFKKKHFLCYLYLF